VGTLAVEGCHLHISLSDKNGAVIGGHLKEGCQIFTTAEIVLGEIEDYVFSREQDDATGFKELAIRKKDN
jgi:predicted DNA-binding protein with PD1-like motif